ncbi:alpha/beta hydrolase [Tractidigestivibacter montrealensis]|uniref:Alpha/beta hydrolase n=1 Tax=Tractidigestivibacter montrealensis TaxID=2972466 RepID=A0ABT1ZAB0_9ACTN|nr:alpha/beta hydrolase [Tractidigestivibacter montrealensis]
MPNEDHAKAKTHVRLRRVALGLLAALAIVVVAFLAYASTYSRATARAEAALAGSDSVRVTATANGYLFDGPGTEDALVFYPGGKVQCEAYAAQLESIAEKGTDVFLVRMPLNFAFLDIERRGLHHWQWRVPLQPLVRGRSLPWWRDGRRLRRRPHQRA